MTRIYQNFSYYVIRGGSWYDFSELACAFYRTNGRPSGNTDDMSFRCARGTR